jgi:uncharacterized protein
MMMGDVSHEPSMEEILSSIKRIIAEDGESALSPPRSKRAVVAPVSPVAAPAQPAEPDILELTETLVEETVAPVAAAMPAPSAPDPVAPTAAATLTSAATLSASRSSIAALSALIVKPDVAGDDTLEGLVRDMLKPMLTQWLDARLPDIVERLVAQEIKRITDRG